MNIISTADVAKIQRYSYIYLFKESFECNLVFIQHPQITYIDAFYSGQHIVTGSVLMLPVVKFCHFEALCNCYSVK